MTLLLAAPAGGATLPRDTVIETPGPGSARISATATTGRYPIDAAGRETVAIGVTSACQASCTAADPAKIAAFLGTLVHGPEIELLTVQLETPSQIGFDCGYGAQACYYGGENKIVLSGDDAPAPDGASREFVLAHEYGHHLARHRETPAPFPPAIDWGTARWASYQNVCRRSRTGSLFPGTLGLRYYRDPGEAFAESFAHLRFPDAGVPWRWVRALKPDAGALRAIRVDALDPWRGREALSLRGRLPGRRAGPAVRSFSTPIDGMVSLRPKGSDRYSLSLLNPAGRVLRSSRHGLSFGNRLNFTVCGQSSLRLALRSKLRPGAYKLQVQRP
ncbi:MAG TPA: hypothetical protein VFT19_02375 [Solirubrobacterales bacterium]|nr:hypothetical protein [Solirubrobacterales bacterium]